MKQTYSNERSKVAIYCRLSDEDHNKINPAEDSRSIQTQKAMLRDYAYQRGWEVYDIYSDDDFSGADANRPEYNRLLDDASQRKFNIVLCKHQSRFTRDMVHVERYINDKFLEWGIRFVSLLDGADTEAKGNKKSRQINGLFNEWYLEDLSANMRNAYITRKKQGKYLASSAIYGYKKDPKDRCHLIIDEPAAEIVRRIFEMRIKGMSLNCIAKVLNDEGVLTPTRYKREVLGENFMGTENLRRSGRYRGKTLWRNSTINWILKNETYTGGLYQNRRSTVSYKNPTSIKLPREQWIICENTHDPIVSKEEFKLATAVKNSYPKVRINGEGHLFTGKLMCGNCGGSICFNSTVGQKHYYRCSMRTNYGGDACSGVSVEESMLINAVLKELKQIFSEWIKEKDIDYLVEHVDLKNDDSRAALETDLHNKKVDLAKIADVRIKLYQDMNDGIITKEDFKELWENYRERQNQLQKEAEVIENKILLEEEKEQLKRKKQEQLASLVREKADFYLQCETLTRDMVDTFLDYIEVYNGEEWGKKELKIHWNF